MITTHRSSLLALADEPVASGVWWSAVARALDDLADRLAADALLDAGPDGALERAVDDEPTLVNRATSANSERMGLQVRVFELRRFVAAHAGDPDQVEPVAGRLRGVAKGEHHYEKRVRAVVWDSLSRDIGGE
jgi:hypothetical protein